MKILMLSNYYPEHVGGIETVTGNLCAAYRRAGHQVTWMAAEVADRPHRGDSPLRAWNFTERRLGFPYPLPAPGALRAVRRAVERTEVIHLHDSLYAANVRAFLASRRLRRPVLLTQHVGPVPFRSPLLRAVQAAAFATIGRMLLTGSEQVTFVSREVMSHFTARVRFRRTPQLVANGVDTDLFQPASASARAAVRERLGISEARLLVLFAGRFVHKKGLDLVRAVAAAAPDWEFMLAGRPGEVDPHAWNLPNVTALPAQAQEALKDLYVASDVLLLPSTGEGFPVTVQEAMSSGTPAVVSSALAAEFPGLGLVGSELEPECLRAAVETAAGTDRGAVAEFARTTWSLSASADRYLELMRAIS
jgi:glycosyltransferase involved in cell wall biosynthesis